MKIKCSYRDDYFNQDGLKLLALTLFFAAGTYGVKAMLISLGLSSLQSIGSLVIYLIWMKTLIIFLLKNQFIVKSVIIYELIYIFILAVNYFVFIDTKPYYLEYKMFLRQILIVFIPAGAIAANITDYNNAFFYMKKTAVFGSFFMIVALFLGYTSIWDYQYFGVQISPFAIILYGNYYFEHKFSDMALCITDIIFVLFGGRQSFFIVLIGMFFVFYFHIKNKRKRLLFIISMLFIGILLYAILPIFISLIIEIAKLVHLDTRTLEMLANGELVDISTRTIIYDTSINIIKRKGYMVTGLFSDRYLIRNYGSYMSWIAYPHNFVLEVLIDFGTVLGLLILVWILTKTIKQFVCFTVYKRSIFGLFFSLVIIRLFVSSSFMIEGLFYVYLGFLFSERDETYDNVIF